MKRLIFLLLLLPLTATAQKPADFIIGIVGEEIILDSDVQAQYQYFLGEGEKDDGTLRCRLVERSIVELLLLSKAKQDSITVGADQVDNELDQRIQDFLGVYKTIENLEKVYQKTYVEIKAELRPEIEKQLLVQQMRSKIVGAATVTPRDVKKFFNEIPKDSLPFMPAEVEVGQIVIYPKFSEVSMQKAQDQLRELRTDILSGRITFEDAAKRYSDDLGSGANGGALGEFKRGTMVPEFDAVVFNMSAGEISAPFKTRFGQHIIKLDKRSGELVTARHILIKPAHTAADDTLAVAQLNRIRRAILDDSISFEKAAVTWSEDPQSRNCGGCLKNPQTGELSIPMDALPADLYFKVDRLKQGEISKPVEILQAGGEKAFHLIILKRKVPAHIANMESDYQRIQEAALQTKQVQTFEKWLETARKNVYIEIKDKECLNSLINWIQ